jgi:hypothetical protein
MRTVKLCPPSRRYIRTRLGYAALAVRCLSGPWPGACRTGSCGPRSAGTSLQSAGTSRAHSGIRITISVSRARAGTASTSTSRAHTCPPDTHPGVGANSVEVLKSRHRDIDRRTAEPAAILATERAAGNESIGYLQAWRTPAPSPARDPIPLRPSPSRLHLFNSRNKW